MINHSRNLRCEFDRDHFLFIDFDSFENCLVEESSLFVVRPQVCSLYVSRKLDGFQDHLLSEVSLDVQRFHEAICRLSLLPDPGLLLPEQIVVDSVGIAKTEEPFLFILQPEESRLDLAAFLGDHLVKRPVLLRNIFLNGVLSSRRQGDFRVLGFDGLFDGLDAVVLL